MADAQSRRDTALKLLQIAAMPFALGLAGWWVQAAINEDNLEVERLKLAVGILTSEDADPAVRQYGAALLEVSSPAGLLTEELRDRLAAGEAILPAGAFEVIAGQSARTGTEDFLLGIRGGVDERVAVSATIEPGTDRAALVAAVGQIINTDSGQHLCTAFRIRSDVIVAPLHCFEETPVEGSSFIHAEAEAASISPDGLAILFGGSVSPYDPNMLDPDQNAQGVVVFSIEDA